MTDTYTQLTIALEENERLRSLLGRVVRSVTCDHHDALIDDIIAALALGNQDD